MILNALRALRRRAAPPGRPAGDRAPCCDRYAGEHAGVRDVLARVRDTADLVATRPTAEGCLPALRETHRRLTDEVLPHDSAEERQLYPALAGLLGGDEAATMSREHVEIHRLVDRIGGHLAQANGSCAPTRCPTCSPACTGWMRCCACTWPRKRRTTPPRPRPAGPIRRTGSAHPPRLTHPPRPPAVDWSVATHAATPLRLALSRP